MNSNGPLFTVFTPTYNRRHTLRRAYDSLCRQDSSLFEWLVIDDGSTDGTEDLLSELASVSEFEIRVLAQSNGGKHRAHNAAISLARGRFTVILDSDDELVPCALSYLAGEWAALPAETEDHYAGILGQSITSESDIIEAVEAGGARDGNLFELWATGQLIGDRLPCYRTSVLRQYPFPAKANNKDTIPEGTVWLRVSRKYLIRTTNTPVLIVHRDRNDPISLMNGYRVPGANAWGTLQYYIVLLNISSFYWPRFAWKFAKAAVGSVRSAMHAREDLRSVYKKLSGSIPRLLWLGALPVGVAAWVYDHIKNSFYVD